jgi:hypothetical protein
VTFGLPGIGRLWVLTCPRLEHGEWCDFPRSGEFKPVTGHRQCPSCRDDRAMALR